MQLLSIRTSDGCLIQSFETIARGWLVAAFPPLCIFGSCVIIRTATKSRPNMNPPAFSLLVLRHLFVLPPGKTGKVSDYVRSAQREHHRLGVRVRRRLPRGGELARRQHDFVRVREQGRALLAVRVFVPLCFPVWSVTPHAGTGTSTAPSDARLIFLGACLMFCKTPRSANVVRTCCRRWRCHFRGRSAGVVLVHLVTTRVTGTPMLSPTKEYEFVFLLCLGTFAAIPRRCCTQ